MTCIVSSGALNSTHSLNNPEHVLQQFLTERHQTYNLRRRPHGSKTFMEKTPSLNEQDFFIRAMYKHSY